MLTANRAVLFCVAALSCASVSAQATQPAEKKLTPGQFSANFIAQFYQVKPDQVTAKVAAQGKHSATVLTSTTGQPDCVLEMVQAPESRPEYSWLISSFTCDKALDQDQVNDWMKKGQPGAVPKSHRHL